MDLLTTFVLMILVAAAASVVVLVLLQHGKGADMGAAFGSGSAGSLFGSAGSANFLSRATSVAATIFFASCFALVLLTSPKAQKIDLPAGNGGAASASAQAPAASAVPAASVVQPAKKTEVPK